MKNIKKQIFIDVLCLLSKNKSGVAHNTLELIRSMEKIAVSKNYQINLVVPLLKRKIISDYNFLPSTTVKTIILPSRIIKFLDKFNLMPPIDLFLGKGAYIFPNYSNLPLAKSKAYTFILDIGFFRYPEFVQPRNRKYITSNIRKWIKRSYKVIAISKFMKNEIVTYLDIPKDKVDIVYCGVDSEVYYRRNSKEISTIKKRYRIKEQKYLLYLGNIEPRKNLERLVLAFDLLPSTIKKEYSLLLVGGDGWLNEGILGQIKLARKNGSKIIRPNKYVVDDDLPALISGATALVHPAIYEGFGISTLQGIACRTPVITSKNSSLAEVVGEGAFLVNPLDVNEIKESIEKVISGGPKVENLIRVGLNQSKKFSWHKSAENLISIIEKGYSI